MRRTGWKRIIGFGVAGAAAGAAALAFFTTYAGSNALPNANKQHAMLRLEDVGPGGDYGSLEGLGRLRAVLEYIASEEVPYHVAVIPRRMTIEDDGAWTERGIDDPEPDDVTTAFVGLLQEAQRSGGALGMHGYTHQYGDVERADGGHRSGTGSEFKIDGAPETHAPAYAAARIASSLAAFEAAGLTPAFWESPHYKDTREQEKVFRSHIGLLYQPDLFSLRSFKDLNVYETINTYGQDSLGSVYVPAPFKYVSDAASIDRMLDKAKDDDGLAALYFHPFKEFDFLEPVVGADGAPAMRGGLPEYRYGANASESYLHRLIGGFREAGYTWMSLHEVVPFTPAHRVALPTEDASETTLFGDATGDGQADAVVRQARRIVVIPGDYAPPRNRTQSAAEVWLKASFAPEERLLLFDADGDGRQDLLAYDSRTGDVRAALAEAGRFRSPEPYGALPAGVTQLRPAEGGLLAMTADRRVQLLSPAEGAGFETIAEAAVPDGYEAVGWLREEGGSVLIVSTEAFARLPLVSAGGPASDPLPIRGIERVGAVTPLLGDANGDGRTDMIFYEAKSGVWSVYDNQEDGRFARLANDFGPWARGKARIGVVADFDGNGKDDIGSYDNTNRVLDLALSSREERAQ